MEPPKANRPNKGACTGGGQSTLLMPRQSGPWKSMANAFGHGVMVGGGHTLKAAGGELDGAVVAWGDLDSRHELTVAQRNAHRRRKNCAPLVMGKMTVKSLFDRAGVLVTSSQMAGGARFVVS